MLQQTNHWSSSEPVRFVTRGSNRAWSLCSGKGRGLRFACKIICVFFEFHDVFPKRYSNEYFLCLQEAPNQTYTSESPNKLHPVIPLPFIPWSVTSLVGFFERKHINLPKRSEKPFPPTAPNLTHVSQGCELTRVVARWPRDDIPNRNVEPRQPKPCRKQVGFSWLVGLGIRFLCPRNVGWKWILSLKESKHLNQSNSWLSML